MEKEEYGVLIDSFEKNNYEQIRISINEYKGKRYIDIRTFYKKKNDEEYLPSKKGITLTEEQYPEFLEGIVQLGETLGFSLKTEI